MGIINHRQWFKLCEQPESSFTTVIRDFYANATARQDSKAIVRGVEVSYTPTTINRLYDLPNIIDDSFSHFEHNLDPEAILRAIASQGGQWRFHENPLLQKKQSEYMNLR